MSTATWRDPLNPETRAALSDLIITLADAPSAETLASWLQIEQTSRDMAREAARDMAAAKSWQAVGQVVGTSREAAWQRWH